MAMEHLYTSGNEEVRYGLHINNGGFRFHLEESDEISDIARKYIEEFKKIGI